MGFDIFYYQRNTINLTGMMSVAPDVSGVLNQSIQANADIEYKILPKLSANLAGGLRQFGSVDESGKNQVITAGPSVAWEFYENCTLTGGYSYYQYEHPTDSNLDFTSNIASLKVDAWY